MQNLQPNPSLALTLRCLCCTGLLLIMLAAPRAATGETPTFPAGGGELVIHPGIDSSAVLNTPARGWETNNGTALDYQNPAHPPSRVAYFKYYLKTFLREDGTIDVSPLSRDLERAKLSGQQLAFRLMIFSEEEGGEILRSFGVSRGFTYRYIDGDFTSPQQWAPDLDDQATQAVLRKLLLALGAAFDGNPALSHIDIGYVGLWGEWHTSDTVPRVPMPSAQTQQHIIDMHFEAFPRTRKIMQLQGVSSLRYALDKGAGIRADCLAGPNTTMMKLYPLTLLAARAQDAWKTAPFIFEICWNLSDWEKRGWDSDAVFTRALDQYHPSLINTKSASIPESMQAAFQKLLTRIGYRFAVREVRLPKSAHSKDPLVLRFTYENSGVAPCYGDFRMLVQLKAQNSSAHVIFPTATQLCNREPGSFELEVSLILDSRIAPGDYNLAVAVAEGNGLTPSVQLANTNPKEGWYWLSTLRIQ